MATQNGCLVLSQGPVLLQKVHFADRVKMTENSRAFEIVKILLSSGYPKDPLDVPNWLKKAKTLQSLLSDCWQNDPTGNIMGTCLNILYAVIASNFVSADPGVWYILDLVEKDQISEFVEEILTNPSKNSNAKVKNVLTAMIEGLCQCGPYVPRLQNWIFAMIQGLETRKNFTVLIEVAENEIPKLLQFLKIPLYRPLIYPTFRQLLYPLIFPHIFYKIIDEVPKVLNILQQDLGDTENNSISLDFAGLIITLLIRFPFKVGYEDKYKLIRMALMQYPETTFEPDSMILWDPRQNSGFCNSGDRRISNDHKESSQVPYKGLMNQGNTCYMNSVLQILYMTTKFRKELMEKEIDFNEKAAYDLQKLFAFMQESTRSVLTPNGVMNSTLPPTFRRGHQQDSSEYLIYLLDIIHESEKKAAKKTSENNSKNEENKREGNGDFIEEEKTVVERLFGGVLVSTTTCSFCEKSFPKNESFRNLHLPVPDDHTSVDLQELIDLSLQPEELGDENMYDCENCGVKRDAIRRHAIVKAPEHLILTLKLFRFDSVVKQRMKLRSRLKNVKSIELPVFDASQSRTYNITYDLKGVVLHSGSSLDGGHYFSSAVDTTGQWYTFNDSIVSSSKFEWNTGGGTPYLLFLRQRGITDPPESPLPSNLQLLVNRDNQKFLTEKKYQKWTFHRKKDYDDDKDDTPPNNGSLDGPSLVF